jgi:aspartyl-tRNA(Asn)/glutamyl-tRNA(Gln) amidotransferase subunit C
MALTLEEVDHIAALARLELSADEKEHYRLQLSAILDYIRKLQELDTRGIPPTASGLISATRLREDEPRPGLKRDHLLANAPEKEEGQFKVPPVFDLDGGR